MQVQSECSSLSWISADLKKAIAATKSAFEAYISSLSTAPDQQKLKASCSSLQQCIVIFDDVHLESAKFLAELILEAIQALAEENSSVQSDIYQVVVGALNQLENHLGRMQKNGNTDEVTLLPVRNDLNAVLGRDFELNSNLFQLADTEYLSAGADQLGSVDLEKATSLADLSNKVFQCLQSEDEIVIPVLTSLSEMLEQFESSVPSQSFTLEIGLALQAIVDAGIVDNGNLSISSRYTLKRTIDALAGVSNEQTQASVAQLKQRFTECLYVLSLLDGLSSGKADYLSLKYGLPSAIKVANRQALLHLGSPDMETVATVVNGLIESVEKIQLALKHFTETGEEPSDPTASRLVSLRQTISMIPLPSLASKLDRIIDSFAKQNSLQDIPESDLSLAISVLFDIEQSLNALSSGSGRSASELQVLQELKVTAKELEALFSQFAQSENIDAVSEHQSEIDAKQTLLNGAVQFLEGSALPEVNRAIVSKYQDDIVNALDDGNKDAAIETATLLANVYQLVAEYFSDLIESQHKLVERKLFAVADLLGLELYTAPAADTLAVDTIVELDSRRIVTEQPVDAGAITEAAVEIIAESTSESTADKAEEEVGSSLTASSYIETPLADELDPDIVEIFLEEAEEVFQTIGTSYQSLSENIEDQAALADLRRSYHTLKGSGRMAGAEHIGNAAWSVENMLNRVIESGGGKCSPARMTMVAEANQYLPVLVDYFSNSLVPYEAALESFVSRVNTLAEDENAVVEQGVSMALEQSKCSSEETAEQRSEHLQSYAETLPEAETMLDTEALDESEEVAVVEAADVEIDSAQELGEAISSAEVDEPASDVVLEDDVLEAAAETNSSASDAGISDTENAAPAASESQPEMTDDADEQLTDICQVFIEELKNQLVYLQQYCEQVTEQDDLVPDESLERMFHTLVGGARIADVNEWGNMLEQAEKLVIEVRRIESIDANDITLLNALRKELELLATGTLELPASAVTLIDSLDERVKQLAAHGQLNDVTAQEDTPNSASNIPDLAQKIFDWDTFLKDWRLGTLVASELQVMQEELRELAESDALPDDITRLCTQILEVQQLFDAGNLYLKAYQALSQAYADLVTALDNVATGRTANITCFAMLESVIEEEAHAASLQSQALAEISGSADQEKESDDEIVSIFLEESADLLEEVETTVAALVDAPNNLQLLENLLRPLHTLKGGARMAGLDAIGSCCHEFEAVLQSAKLSDKRLGKPFFNAIQSSLTELHELFNQIGHGESTAENTDDQADASQADKRVVEMVRVPAELLEGLVNLAGETSISRSLVEEKVADFSHSIDEVESTVDRLKEQLRRLEIETEAQIAFRKEKVEVEGLEEFDPLEMDRYSLLQQLSKSLVESASDLKDLKTTLREKTRDVETLLLQQSRINTELQEGLMRTRTVSVSRSIVPRLRKTIRQVSGELDKPITFNVGNTDGELDKSVIERMVAPLEHVLRNAIDHGIETGKERQASGKPEAGAINLTIDREGGDVVVRISDDGRGIDTDGVRKKALEKGLIEAEQRLTEEEIQQLIFAPGFSTAQSVTEISGRGVGMDVARSEIQELGGTVELESVKGAGTTFVFRLPFTMSMNRALLVSAGGESIAVPLDTIEGIVRVSPYELEEYYGQDSIDFVYAGQHYDFNYLGTVLNGSKPSYSTDAIGALPVLLVRNGHHLIAYQVDRLLGSREIVVKSLGPQFTNVSGINGATVLGDGSVVMIADLGSLQPHVLASDAELKNAESAPSDATASEFGGRATAMVVDDSVTVRKVTSRLLEREGFDVVTAKDGLDAMEKLEDIKPDVILLDIEMPRLDGFEVVSRVRHDERLKDLPIIMISSRTGEKHRDRALSLGANEFLGKPYQDQVLLAAIQEAAPQLANLLAEAS